MITARHKRFIEIAYQRALSANGVHKHATVIVASSRIIGIGCNDYSRGQHSESAALDDNWLSNFKGATAYNVRIRKAQKFGLSAPCEHCLLLLQEAGIKKVVFTTDDPNNPIEIRKVG
jgi:pyrimidine deaminase RibD-like protein